MNLNWIGIASDYMLWTYNEVKLRQQKLCKFIYNLNYVNTTTQNMQED